MLVLIVLLSYFASKIISAKEKLEAQKIGTLTSDKFEDTVKDRTKCYFKVAVKETSTC